MKGYIDISEPAQKVKALAQNKLTNTHLIKDSVLLYREMLTCFTVYPCVAISAFTVITVNIVVTCGSKLTGEG